MHVQKSSNICKCCGSKEKCLASMKKLDFDGSVFNHVSEILFCSNCGFFEAKSTYSDSEIEQYYANHVFYSSMSGVGVGNETSEDIVRYEKYARILEKSDGKLVDIGCSKGGWLKYLDRDDDFNFELIGIDVDISSMKEGAVSPGLKFTYGSVFNTRLPDKSVDILTYFHVLEHVDNLNLLLDEALRVLKSDGQIIIEVPNAPKYPFDYVGNGFWLYNKEHLNHFGLSSLNNLAVAKGLVISDYVEQSMPMENGYSYPSIIVKLKRPEAGVLKEEFCSVPPVMLDEFILNELRLSQGVARFLIELPKPLVFWRIGTEFFNFFSMIVEPEALDFRLLDSNESKQKCTVLGKEILSPENFAPEGTLIITSYMSTDAILKSAGLLGWESNKVHSIKDLINEVHS